MNNWRLVADSVGYLVIGTHDLYLAAIDKKESTSAVVKQVGTLAHRTIPIKDDGVDACKFLLMFKSTSEGHFSTFIKSNKLPSEDWFEVKNMYEPHIASILTSEKIENGEVKDTEFEIIFSDLAPGQVSFVSTKSELHAECMAELTRRVNFEFCKKVRKRIPGHRYDTLDDTFYYLGTFYSHKKSGLNSVYSLTSDNEVGLFVKKLRPEDKSVADILRTRSFGTGDMDIMISYNNLKMSAADSGEALAVDKDLKIEDYWESIMTRTLERCTLTEKGSFGVHYSEPKYIFDVLSVQTYAKSLIELPAGVHSMVEKLVKEFMHKLIIKYWNLTTYTIGDNSILSKNSMKDNVDHLVNIYLSRFPDENIKSDEYYSAFFRAAKIDLHKLAEEELSSWDNGLLMTADFNYYLKNLEYVYSRKSPECVQLMDEHAESKLHGIYKLAELRPATNLIAALTRIFNDAKTNYGEKVSSYKVSNMGTKKNPVEFISCCITIQDLINYFGGIDKVPEEVKNEIMTCEFNCVNIYIDSNKELE